MTRNKATDSIELFHDYNVHVPTRTIYLGSQMYLEGSEESGTDFLMAESLTKNLRVLNHLSDDPITIVMCNPGGSDYYMYSMYDEIKASSAHVTIIGSGYVASAGAFIMQAADHRIMRPHARFMIHYGSGGIYDAEWQVLCEVYKGVLLESLRKKHPKFKESKLEEWLLHPHTWFSAQEAASYGFIDEVL